MAEEDQIFTGGAYRGDDDSEGATVGTLTVSPVNILFQGEGLILNFPMPGIVVELDADERILFSHPNYPGWHIYSLDSEITEHRALRRFALKEGLEKLRYQRDGPTRHAVRVYATMGGLLLFFICLWAFKNPILWLVVNAMPAEVERQVGKAAFEEMSDEFELTHEPELTNRLFKVTERLKRGFPPGSPRFEYFVADDDMINAFALPGGHVVVMRGLLESATPDELAGVLAHEVAHVLEKHGMRQIAQLIGPMLIAQYLFNSSGAASALIAGGAEFGSLKYSRDNEFDADTEGWDIMVRANIDPRAMTSFFRKIQNMEGKLAFEALSTHPATAERIRKFDERWEVSLKKSGYQPVDAGTALKKAAN